MGPHLHDDVEVTARATAHAGAALAGDADADPSRPLGEAFRPLRSDAEARRTALESETERWSILTDPPPWAAPDLGRHDAAQVVLYTDDIDDVGPDKPGQEALANFRQ